ncbi:MAG: branched-chain amino acid ABC transporter permease [Deltaproteobacteria bacterium]|nr:branched-chain amino acid ABC transporter permease [Deltaproteobacteria bacterium]
MESLLVFNSLNILYEVFSLLLVALGLGIIFGLLRVMNMAHGEFISLGAFTAVSCQMAGLSYWVAFPATLVVCGSIGFLLERFLIRQLYNRPFDTLVATWGLSILLRKLLELGFGKGYQSLELPLSGSVSIWGTGYPAYRLLLMGFIVILVGGLTLWYNRSSAAMRVKAMIGNPELAESVGLNTQRLACLTFICGVCCAGLAGTLLAPLYSVYPAMGLDYLLRSFFILVIGGVGNLWGLFTGAAIIGGLQSGLAVLVNQTAGYFAVLIVAIIFLWRNPDGIFHRA